MLATLLATMVPAESTKSFLASRDLPCPEDHEKALALAVKSSGVKTQGEVSALVVNLTHGTISGAQLTEVLKAAFPTDKVGDRHGPYYLSLCRTGKIKVDFTPAKKTGTPKVEAATRIVNVPDPRTPILEARVAELEAKIAKALGCQSAKDIKAALNG